MKKRSLYLAVAGLVVGSVVTSRLSTLMPHTVYVPVTAAYADSKSGKTEDSDEDAALFANHREWRRVNPDPYIMSVFSANNCTNGRPSKPSGNTKSSGPRDPHQGRYIVVYVNKLGEEAMFDETHQTVFPEGSIIVKEKMEEATSDKPVIMTAMVKRAPGYNPDSGDWEYYGLMGDGRVVLHGTLSNCQGCHQSVKKQDYVYGDYVPRKEKPAESSNEPAAPDEHDKNNDGDAGDGAKNGDDKQNAPSE